MFKPVFACVLMALWLCASAAARVPDTNAEPELLVSAATSCSDFEAPLRNAETLLARSESFYSTHDAAAGKASYDAGVQDLAAAPWYNDNTACDPPHYTLRRYVATLQSLAIAAANDIMQPFEAYLHLGEMKSVWKPYPLDIDLFFDQRYPELEARRWKYYQAILSASKPQMVEAHNPTTANCEWPNLDADVLTATTPYYPSMARENAPQAVEVIVRVNLSADATITGTTVTQSSGNTYLDRAAIDAARQSTYLPAVKGCTRIPGWFDFRVAFSPAG